jgi:hypothetical protein
MGMHPLSLRIYGAQEVAAAAVMVHAKEEQAPAVVMFEQISQFHQVTPLKLLWDQQAAVGVLVAVKPTLLV